MLAARDYLLPDPIIEAPYIIHRDGWYYLFLSHNSCCKRENTQYKLLVGRSRDLKGPYVDHEGTPLLDGGGTVLIEREGTMIGTGHADVYSEGGYDYLVHHAYDSERGYEPILNIRRMNWDEEGWPSACRADS
jgi:arabinan endo-1,5-alpha-L-arabinosidase